MSTKTKKIVMIGPSLYSKGGIASVVCAYYNGGLFTKWPIIYITTHIEGTKVRKIDAALRALIKFGMLVLSNQIELLHVHVPRRNAFWRKSVFILLAYLVKRPVLIHLHSGGFSDFYWKECGRIRKGIVRYVLNHADRLIVLSSQWWKILDGITDNKRLVKIPNFIQSANDDLSENNRNKNTILFLGRLIDEKGFFELLNAIKLVKVRFPNVKLMCGGEGKLDVIHNYLVELDIVKNVVLLGWVNEAKKDCLFRSTSIFILPSHIEGFPMVLLEAMNRAVPIIATSVGGVPDILENGHDGILINSGDIDAIARSLIYLLENVTFGNRIGEAGRIKLNDKFTLQKVLPILEDVYVEFGVNPIH